MDDGSSIRSIFNRIKSKVDKLEQLCETIPEEIESKRVVREHWYSWHNLWKKAWMHDSSSELTAEEKEKLKVETSVTTRYQAIDL